MLLTSGALTTSLLSQRSSEPAYYTVDCRISKLHLCSKKKFIGNYYVLKPQKELRTNHISSTDKLFSGEFLKNIFFSSLHFDLFGKMQKPQRSLDIEGKPILTALQCSMRKVNIAK